MRDGSSSNDVVKQITINDVKHSEDSIDIVVRLDITSESKEKHGRKIDGDDYRSNYWAAMLSYDKDSEKLNVTKVFYLTSDGAEEYEPGLTSVELKAIKEYIMENVVNK